MNRRGALKAFAGILLCPLCPSPLRAWSYDEGAADGPAHWGGTCDSGTKQSPIDIVAHDTAQLPGLHIDWNGTATEILNNGETIQVNVSGGSLVVGNPVQGGIGYTLRQFHFHYPSEHKINGVEADMEVHFVHAGGPLGLGVVAVRINAGAANPAFARVVEVMPQAGRSTQNPAGINPMLLLPRRPRQMPGSYFRYDGSLTTPTGSGNDCTENVTWMLLEQPIEVDPRDIATYKGVIREPNARPVQRTSGATTGLSVQRSLYTWDQPCVEIGDTMMCDFYWGPG
ncbi:MAG TPA: carbonic anhydrase family protein [Afifellaceae bacterium]|nr:carbonic anhydrase family protein [Afifellaceae bacterium]